MIGASVINAVYARVYTETRSDITGETGYQLLETLDTHIRAPVNTEVWAGVARMLRRRPQLRGEP